jgi:hypothetical protein
MRAVDLVQARAEARPRPVLQGAVAAMIIAFAYGDGVTTAVQLQEGLESPFVLLFPLLCLAVLLIALDSGRLPARLVVSALAGAGFGAALMIFQVNYFDGVNLLGAVQLLVYFLFLLGLVELFAASRDGLAVASRRLLVYGHYVGCAYLVLTFLVWQAFGRDISVVSLIAGTPPQIDDVYGFRPRAFAREPAWAAFTLLAAYVGVYLLVPRERLRGFVALALAIGVLGSGTAFLLVATLVVAGLFQARGTGSSRARFAVLTIVGVVLLAVVFRGRIGEVVAGLDPSGLMRSDSAGVAWEVAERSFPAGVGYGNFRAEASYGHEFVNYIDLDTAADYKSDIMVLNYLAEFGIVAVVIIAWLVALLARGRHPLFWAYLAALLLLAGGPLMPAVALLAVVAGLREREWRLTRAAEGRPAAAVPAPAPTNALLASS